MHPLFNCSTNVKEMFKKLKYFMIFSEINLLNNNNFIVKSL